MTITVNNVQTANSTTLSYTPSSVSNAVLLVFVACEDVSGGDDVTGVTFGATSMDKCGEHVEVLGANEQEMDAYRLASPGTSAETITVSGGERQNIIALTLGADSALTFEQTFGAGASSTTITNTFTPTNNNGIAVTCAHGGDNTELVNTGSGTDFTGFLGVGGYVDGVYETYSTAASTTHSWSCAVTSRTATLAVIFYEGSAPSGRIMSSLAHFGGLAGMGGLAGIGGGLAG